MLWTRLILAIAKSWNLKPESGTWKQEESIGFLSNLKMCFCLLVELDVFVLFCTSSSLHFPGGVPKKPKKTKDFGLFKPRLRQDSKIFVFFGFFGTSSGNGNVFHQKLAFSWRGTKKPKKPKILDSSALTFAKTLKSLFFLVFLVPPQEMPTFSTKSLHFPGEVPKKPKKPKILDSSALTFAKTLKS